MSTCLSHIRRAVLVTAAVLGLATTGPAGAAPIIVGSVYSEYNTKSCGGTTTCSMAFSAIPAGKSVVIRNLTCSVRHGTSATTPILFPFTGNGRIAWPKLGLAVTSGGTRVYTVNEEMFALFTAGQSPAIGFSVNTATTIFLYCTISGDIR